jgi:hypothetical protein
VSRGVTNIVGPTAGPCGLPTWQGIGLDHLPRTEQEKYHAQRESDQLSRTEGKSRPRRKGAAKAARVFRFLPKVYELFS